MESSQASDMTEFITGLESRVRSAHEGLAEIIEAMACVRQGGNDVVRRLLGETEMAKNILVGILSKRESRGPAMLL